MAVKERDRILVQYVGTLDDGTVFDSTEQHNGEPLEFVVGAHEVIPGFEKAVIDMEIESEKSFHLSVEDAYGVADPQLVQEIPREKINVKDLKIGMMLGIQLPSGHHIPATVKEIDDKKVLLDMNHPLAGKALNFKLKLQAITEENVNIESSCGCGCESCDDDCNHEQNSCDGNCDCDQDHDSEKK